MSRLRIVETPGCVYVMGTDQVEEARAALPSDVIAWNVAESGRYAKRQGFLRYMPEHKTVKDARPGVRFSGILRCTCATGRPAFCPAHKCDCNIWCDCSNKAAHIFAPGEWCGDGRTWTERRPGGNCRVHAPQNA